MAPHPRRFHRPAPPAELAAAAAITPDDIASAASTWRRKAPRSLATLLDAEPIEPARPHERTPPSE